MRIIDCFPYFNEKELLELRINLLYDYVDKFIICEGNYTQSGIKKDYTCKNILKELNLPTEKIIVVEVNMPPLSEEKNSWVRERMQRDAAEKFIEKDDICFISDCDEIINPEYIEYYSLIAKSNPNCILRVPLIYLNGRADLRVHDEFGAPRRWDTPFMCLKSHLENLTLSQIRESHAMKKNNIPFPDIFITESGIIKDAGWHFSWMGNSEIMKEKSLSSMHVQDHIVGSVAQFGTKEMLNFLEKYTPQENSTDPLGRKDHILKKYPVENLPKKIFELERVKNFLGLFNNKEHILLEVGKENNFNWKDHKDFAIWVVNELNPKITVDLGVDYGYSSFCFALPNKGIVYGIDSFEGDLHAGQRNTYDYVLNKQKQLNLNNLILVKGYFEEIAKVWNQEIDILHIDGFHTYEAVKNDYENWSKFVSDDGVILFHDTIVDHPTFGVRKFFEEINLPKLNFTHCNGLGVVSKNENLINKIKMTFPNTI